MTTSLQTDPRRATRDVSRKPIRAPLEMPVLFQLADLSLAQSKGLPPISPAPAPISEVIAPPTATQEPAGKLQPPNPEISSVELSPAIAPPPEDGKVELQPAVMALDAAINQTRSAPTVAAEPSLEVPPKEKTTEPDSRITINEAARTTETTPPKEPTAPTPRERAEQRAKNRQPVPTNNDWMRTHGKFIAVGFIVALIAVIYLAQNGDEPPPANPESAVSAKAEQDAQEPLPIKAAESKITDAYTAKESTPAQESVRSPELLKEANPADEQSPAAHAELHAPTAGDSIQEPDLPGEVAESTSLFPWKEPESPRVATKPDDGRSKVQLNPHVTRRQPELEAEVPANESATEMPSVYGPPGSQPQEPATESPSNSEPQLNAPTNYPVTNPSSVGEFQPAQNRPASVPPRATPASYQPGSSNNVPPTRTSGPRYERTGSGLY